MLVTLYTNFYYYTNSQFVNDFYWLLYTFTVFLKPAFYLSLYLGMLLNLRIKTFPATLTVLIIILAIFLGLPIKEYIDFFDFKTAKEFFEGKEYILPEYCLTHFIVNIIVENIPIAFLVLMNNLMLNEKSAQPIYDPIITNSLFIFTNIVIICLLNYHKINF
jgi:hypothetical protein